MHSDPSTVPSRGRRPSHYPDPYAGQVRVGGDALPPPPRPAPRDAGIVAALQQVVHSSHQLLAHRLDLLRLDVQQSLEAALQRAICGLGALACLSVAAILLLVSACLFLGTLMRMHLATLCVGGTFLGLAALLWFLPGLRSGAAAAATQAEAAAAMQQTVQEPVHQAAQSESPPWQKL